MQPLPNYFGHLFCFAYDHTLNDMQQHFLYALD